MSRIVLALLFLGLVATGCAPKTDKPAEDQAKPSTETTTEDGPQLAGEPGGKPARKANEIEEVFWRNFRTSFMTNCTGGNSGGVDISPDKKRAYCQCTLDKLEETYPTMDAALKVASNQDAILKLAGQCMQHLGVE